MIKSGTLRRAIQESIEQKIISKNLLLLTIGYLQKYSTDDPEIQKQLDSTKQEIAKLLIRYEGQQIKADIQEVVRGITAEYLLSEDQAKAVIKMVLEKQYRCYQRYFIKDCLLRFRPENNKADREQKPKYNRLSAAELKMYIYQNELLENVLENLGCHSIKNHAEYIRCGHEGGTRADSISIRNDPYLNVTDFVRDLNKISSTPDIITLVQFEKNLNFKDAVLYLHDILGLKEVDLSKLEIADIDYSESNAQREQQEKEQERQEYQKALKFDLQNYNNACELMPIEWLLSGVIVKSTSKRFEIRADENFIYIPIKNYKTGEIIGIKRRTRKKPEEIKLFGIPKYTQTKGYKKSDNVYGLYENLDSIKSAGYCVIFESEKSVIKRNTMMDATGTALQGHIISDQQAEIIASLNLNEVVIAFDKDVTKEEVLFYCDKLLNHGVKKVSYIFDEWNYLEAKDSPADANNKDYRFLFENRLLYSKDKPENIA